MKLSTATIIMVYSFIINLAAAAPKPPGRDEIVFCNGQDLLSPAQEAVCQRVQAVGAGLGTFGDSGGKQDNGERGEDSEKAESEL